MTLLELFKQHGITRPIDLAKRAQLSRQYAHLIWTGQRQITRKMARHIEAAAGIPYAELMAAEPPRPRQPGTAEPPAPGRQAPARPRARRKRPSGEA
jgi:transcriptional regulator with XRE-family HTH domain